MPSSAARGRPRADVYLLPTVIGGGWGDVANLADAARTLAADGHPMFLFRPRAMRGPVPFPGPFSWPAVRPVRVLRPTGPRAVTLGPAFGLAAAPARPGPLGRPGPWADAVAAIERRYGPEHTLHVSLEEFARTYRSSREDYERYREGGVARAVADLRRRSEAGRRERALWRTAFRRFRALDRPNVVRLLPTFRRSAPFAREYPEFVQVGPLWPPRSPAPRRRRRAGRPTVVWYASPASATVLAPAVVRGLEATGRPAILRIRSPRPVPTPPSPTVSVQTIPVSSARRWRAEFRRADLRIVTGSRTLLEAIDAGGPFLYFNGVLRASTGRLRAHRPEKLASLLALYRGIGVPEAIRRDLAAFARGARVGEIVERAIADRAWRSGFPSAARVRAATPPPLAARLRGIVRRFAVGRSYSTAFRVDPSSVSPIQHGRRRAEAGSRRSHS
ncbi:MAG TPA: hypothetical protein VLX64_00375 [Thermoplasmata archaeon]|nr:hypothetical protein [Thermoplasmata archaeon]HUJ77438.1 hypothetical protein [Thermoplasmata archaeon]